VAELPEQRVLSGQVVISSACASTAFRRRDPRRDPDFLSCLRSRARYAMAEILVSDLCVLSPAVGGLFVRREESPFPGCVALPRGALHVLPLLPSLHFHCSSTAPRCFRGFSHFAIWSMGYIVFRRNSALQINCIFRAMGEIWVLEGAPRLGLEMSKGFAQALPPSPLRATADKSRPADIESRMATARRPWRRRPRRAGRRAAAWR
jgi:hypothetical protein